MAENKRTWTSCCRRKGNCPSVARDGRVIWVRDDYGNTIKITYDQLRDILQTISELPAEDV